MTTYEPPKQGSIMSTYTPYNDSTNASTAAAQEETKAAADNLPESNITTIQEREEEVKEE